MSISPRQIVTVLLIGFLMLIGTTITSNSFFSSKIEARSLNRLQLEAQESVAGWNVMQVICDTETGTLLYRTNSGLWGNPNGCQKSR